MKKWREPLLDPNEIEFENISIESINSYPPAGNDVMECTGVYKDSATIEFFLKIQRSKFADFESEMEVLKLLDTKFNVPKVLEFGEKNDLKYIALTKLEGSKFNDTYTRDNLNIYGDKLAEIHTIDIDIKDATQRKINDYPKSEHYNFNDEWENSIVDFLVNNKPDIKFDTFIHGDFHYGNILWSKNEIVGVVDWEYAGKGFKEQDIAWALILRNTQKFLTTTEEINYFLEGYNKKGSYDNNKFKWCLINGYMHFYLMNVRKEEKDQVYLDKLKKLINSFLS